MEKAYKANPVLIDWLKSIGIKKDLAKKLLEKNQVEIISKEEIAKLGGFFKDSDALAFHEISQEEPNKILNTYYVPFDVENLKIVDKAYQFLGKTLHNASEIDLFEKAKQELNKKVKNQTDERLEQALTFPRVKSLNEIQNKDDVSGNITLLGESELDPKNNNLFITLSPVDKLILNAIGETNVLTIPLSTIYYKNQSLFTFLDKLKNIFNTKDNEDLRFHFKNFILILPLFEKRKQFEKEITNRLGADNITFFSQENLLQENFIKKPINSLFELAPNINFHNSEKFHKEFPSENGVAISCERLKETIFQTGESFLKLGEFDFKDSRRALERAMKFGLQEGFSTGFRSLDENFTIHLGGVTCIQGISQSGKSNLVKNLCLNLAKQDISTCYFIDNQNEDVFFQSLVEIETNRITPTLKQSELYHNGALNEIDKRQFLFDTDDKKYQDAVSLIQSHIKGININLNTFQDDSEESTLINPRLSELLKEFKNQCLLHGTKNFVIDGWKKICPINNSKLRDDEYLLYQLEQIEEFARKHQVHIFILNSPKTMRINPRTEEYYVPKLLDAVGGQIWGDKCTCFITLYRRNENTSQEIPLIDNIVEIRIQRVANRSIGKNGKVVLTSTNPSGKLFDKINLQKYNEHLIRYYSRGDRFNLEQVFETDKTFIGYNEEDEDDHVKQVLISRTSENDKFPQEELAISLDTFLSENVNLSDK